MDLQGFDIKSLSQLLTPPQQESDSDEDDKVCIIPVSHDIRAITAMMKAASLLL